MLSVQLAHAIGECPTLAVSSILVANERGKESIVTTQPKYTMEKFNITSQRPNLRPSMEFDKNGEVDSAKPSKS